MNTQTNAMPSPPLEFQVVAAEVIPLTQQVYWALQLESWESRWIYLVRLYVAALFLKGFLIHMPMHELSARVPSRQHDAIIQPYDMAAALLMGTFLFVAMFYCIETLQRERRVRS